ALFAVTGRRQLSSSVVLSANAYYRDIRTSTFNGDVNTNSLDQAVYQPTSAEQAALAAAGYSGVPASGASAANTPFPFWRCLGQVSLDDEPAEKCDGVLNRTDTEQHNAGASAQVVLIGRRGGHGHQLTMGGGFDRSSVAFNQSTQLGYLNPD